MAEIAGGVQRYQADDFRQFTLTATVTRPMTVTYQLFDPLGALLPITSISPVNSGVFVQESATIAVNSSGLFHIEYVIPTTVGFYTSVWKAYNVASQAGVIRQEFEVIRTEPRSFRSYGNVADILRTARVIFKQHDITAREMQDYMEPSDNRIDSMLAKVTTVPVDPAPPILRDCNKAFTLWAFYSDRFAAVNDEAPPGLQDRYDKCMEYFTEIMSGNMVLVTDSANIEAVLTLDSTTVGFKPVFDMRDFGSMRADPDLVAQDDDEDDR